METLQREAKQNKNENAIENAAEQIRVFGLLLKHSTAFIAIVIAGVGGIIVALLAFPDFSPKSPDALTVDPAPVINGELGTITPRQVVADQAISYAGAWYDDQNNLIQIAQSGSLIELKLSENTEIGVVDLKANGNLIGRNVSMAGTLSSVITGTIPEPVPITITFIDPNVANLSATIFGITNSTIINRRQ